MLHNSVSISILDDFWNLGKNSCTISSLPPMFIFTRISKIVYAVNERLLLKNIPGGFFFSADVHIHTAIQDFSHCIWECLFRVYSRTMLSKQNSQLQCKEIWTHSLNLQIWYFVSDTCTSFNSQLQMGRVRESSIFETFERALLLLCRFCWGYANSKIKNLACSK